MNGLGVGEASFEIPALVSTGTTVSYTTLALGAPVPVPTSGFLLLLEGVGYGTTTVERMVEVAGYGTMTVESTVETMGPVGDSGMGTTVAMEVASWRVT